MNIQSQAESVKQFVAAITDELALRTKAKIEARLQAEVTSWLGRERYEKRQRARGKTQAICQRCGTQQASNFSRNGSRERTSVTTFGVLPIQHPRVVCCCGGSVQIPFTIHQPYQRFWDDFAGQVGRWTELGLSLRQMQDEIGKKWQTQVGLRKLNSIQHDWQAPSRQVFSSVPPVVMLDGIWVPLLSETGVTHTDPKGRQRAVKAGEKVCVLVALGLYPQSGRWGILGWHIAEEESQTAWEALLLPLEQRGLYRERGVELFIHDGGSGLRAALNLLYPHIPHQRCLFHKLRNLWNSIQPPTSLSHPERRTFKRDLLQSVLPLLDAANVQQALQLRDTLVSQWLDTQPKFVETLLRDWHETVAFLRVLDRFPHWPRSALRTTSLLERVNRMLRRAFRAAGAFQSPSGLNACISRVLAPKSLT